MMKTFALTAAAFAACALTHAHAQVVLGSYYNTGEGQSINTVADFTAAGVTGPGGALLASNDAVTGFNFMGYGDTNPFNGATFTSNGLTLNPGGLYFTSGSGVFQSSVFLTPGESLTGLSSVLQPDTAYTLYLFSDPIFGGNENVTFSYGSQTGLTADVSGDVSVPFSFTTGSAVTDELTFNGEAGTTNPSTFPSITGFAIVNEVPEPATGALLWASLGLLGALALRRSRSAVAPKKI